jgi:sugar-specific transcriptional regulator TrmB
MNQDSSETIRAKLSTMLAPYGLTENDTKVFITLHMRGEMMLGAKIAHLSGLPRQYVYTSLEKLVSLLLIESQVEKGRKRYKAYPPSKIVRLAEKKVFEAEDIKAELSAISKVGAEQEFEVYYGDKEVVAYERNYVKTMPHNMKQYIIGGSSDIFLQYFGDINDELNAAGRERGLESYYIACKEEMPWPEIARKSQKAFHYRILDTLPRTIVSTVVRNDTVVMYSMATPPLIYSIKSKRIADDYKKHFDMLWNMATPSAGSMADGRPNS